MLKRYKIKNISSFRCTLPDGEFLRRGDYPLKCLYRLCLSQAWEWLKNIMVSVLANGVPRMTMYKNVLIAVELDPDCDKKIIKKAQEVVQTFKSKLILVHAVEQLLSYGAAYGVSVGVDIEEELMKEAKKSLTKIGKELNVPAEQQIVRTGPAKFIILDECEKNKIDLIIVGSHGRHGIQLILGSTANAVLHQAKCDVLAVRI